jgi:hypothetical protein
MTGQIIRIGARYPRSGVLNREHFAGRIVAALDVLGAIGVRVADAPPIGIVAIGNDVAVLIDVLQQATECAIHVGLHPSHGIGLGDQIAVGVIGAPVVVGRPVQDSHHTTATRIAAFILPSQCEADRVLR